MSISSRNMGTFKAVLQDTIDIFVPLTSGIRKKKDVCMDPEAFRLNKLKQRL